MPDWVELSPLDDGHRNINGPYLGMDKDGLYSLHVIPSYAKDKNKLFYLYRFIIYFELSGQPKGIEIERIS